MKHLEDIVFDDPQFPIKIVPERSSVVSGEASRAFHEAVEIKYFYEGESTLLIGSDTLTAKAGDVIVINPYEFHATVDTGEAKLGKYHLIMIGLDFFEGAIAAGTDLRRLFFDRGITLNTRVGNIDRAREILDRAVDIYKTRESTARLSLFGLCAELFALLLLEANEAKEAKERKAGYMAIEPAIIMIRDRFSESITLDALAEASRKSKYHFSRRFREVMGMGAIEYLNEHRLRIADALLKSTDQSVGEVARAVGFKDTGYFSRSYKKRFGRTPRSAKNGDTD